MEQKARLKFSEMNSGRFSLTELQIASKNARYYDNLIAKKSTVIGDRSGEEMGVLWYRGGQYR